MNAGHRSAILWAIVAVLAAAVYWNRTRDPTPIAEPPPIDYGPIEPAQELTRLPGLSSDIHSINGAADGHLLIAGKYGLVRLPGGDPRQAQDIEINRSDLGLRAFSFAREVPGQGLWVGDWGGNVIGRERSIWALTASAGSPCKGAVRGIEHAAGRLFVLCDARLWRSDENGFAREDLRGVERIGTVQGELLAGAGDGLYRRVDSNWERIVPSSSHVQAWTRSGPWMVVGTEHGVFRYHLDSEIVEVMTERGSVTDLAALPDGGIWIGHWGDGLSLWRDGQIWDLGYAQGLPDDDVIGVTLGPQGRQLWIALYGGVQYVDVQVAERLAVEQRPGPQLLVEEYDNACSAVEDLMGDTPIDGEIAHQRIDGTLTVFYQGHQVCPDPKDGPVSHRRADGGLVTIQRDGRVAMRPPTGDQVNLELADPFRIQHLLLTSKDRIWVGGLSRLVAFDGKSWADRSPEVVGNITALAEDAQGAIWVGTHPKYNSDAGAYEGPNLYRFAGDGSESFDPNRGLPYWSTADLRPLQGGMVVGTNGGAVWIHNEVVKHSWSSGMSVSTTVDRAGKLWVAHLFWDPGISVHDDRGERARIDTRNGLFADKIRALALDDQQRIWLMDDGGRVAVYSTAQLEAVGSDR